MWLNPRVLHCDIFLLPPFLQFTCPSSYGVQAFAVGKRRHRAPGKINYGSLLMYVYDDCRGHASRYLLTHPHEGSHAQCNKGGCLGLPTAFMVWAAGEWVRVVFLSIYLRYLYL